MRFLNLICILLIFISGMSCSKKNKADLLVINAKIYTVDSVQTIVTAMAVKDGKILATGTDDEIQGAFTSEKVIDAGSKAIYPGFIDAHCHFYGLGLSKISKVDLAGSLSFDDVIERVRTYYDKYKPEWIEGRGWDQNLWKVKKFPDKLLLDKMFPGIPVILTRVDGHAAVVSSEALKRAGIHSKTKIKGGEIVMDHGEPSGLLIDNAIELVNKVIPSPSEKIKRLALHHAQEVCFSNGLTSVTDAGLEYDVLQLMEQMYASGELMMRINAMISPSSDNIENYLKKGIVDNDHFSIHSVKLYADGALGSRGAMLLEPYSDDPHNCGLMVTDQEVFDSVCVLALEKGYQVNTHAIGDSAIRRVLKTYAGFLKEKNNKRWRIEHAQVVNSKDFHLFGDYSIIPSVQPTHATSDMEWADERLGQERIKGAYAYKELLMQNGWLPLGTDFPIEQVNPLLTFYAAVTRQDLKGNPAGGFQSENSLTPYEALKGITIWAARADFNEHITRSLESGKYADFVILDQDIMKIKPGEIPHVKVVATFIGGQCVYGKGY